MRDFVSYRVLSSYPLFEFYLSYIYIYVVLLLLLSLLSTKLEGSWGRLFFVSQISHLYAECKAWYYLGSLLSPRAIRRIVLLLYSILSKLFHSMFTLFYVVWVISFITPWHLNIIIYIYNLFNIFFQAFDWILPIPFPDHIYCNASSKSCWSTFLTAFPWCPQKSRSTQDTGFFTSHAWFTQISWGIENFIAINGFDSIAFWLA